MAFPSTPILGDLYTTGSTTYKWDGSEWVEYDGTPEWIIRVNPSGNFAEITNLYVSGQILLNGVDQLTNTLDGGLYNTDHAESYVTDGGQPSSTYSVSIDGETP